MHALNFHEDLLLDPRYKAVFAVASGLVPGQRFQLLTGDNKVALGFVVDTGDEVLDAADPVPVDDWLFGWIDLLPEDGEIWYVFEPGVEDGPGSQLVGYKWGVDCQCWRPRVVFDMTEGAVDECEEAWGETGPLEASEWPEAVDDGLVVEYVEPNTEAANDR